MYLSNAELVSDITGHYIQQVVIFIFLHVINKTNN